MGPFTGALISGGASLIGGLLNPKKSQSAAQKSIAKSNIKRVITKNKQEEAWNRAVEKKAVAAAKIPIIETTTSSGSVDVGGMMKAAEASGFNPVTFLQAGGMAAYTRTSTKTVTTGEHAYEAATVGLSKPEYAYYQRETGAPQSSGQSIGETLSGALSAGANSYMAIQQQVDQNAFQKEMVMTQLLANNQSRATRYGLGGGPTFSGTGGATISNGQLTVGKGGGVGDLVSIVTAAGKLLNPNAVDEESYIGWGGSLLGPAMKLFAETPGIVKATLANPASRKALEQTGTDWLQMADDFMGYIGDRASDRIQKNTGVRLLTNQDIKRFTSFDYTTWVKPTTAPH